MQTITAITTLLAALTLGHGTALAGKTFTGDASSKSLSQQGTAPAPATTPTATASELSNSARLREEIKVLENLLSPAQPSGVSDRGAVLYLLADHYLGLGDRAKALALLEECAKLDEGFDPGDDPGFAPLKNDAAFRALVAQVRQRYPSVHRAHLAFTVAQNDLIPEGLDVDAAKRVFYMSSMRLKKIVKITEKGEVAEFVRPDQYDLMPILGVHMDPADHGVWCATYPGAKNRGELVHFDEQGQLLERYSPPGPGPHSLNDLVLRDKREIYVTDTQGNRVYRFDRGLRRFAELELSRRLFWPNGITLSNDGNVLYIADLLGIIRLDLRTNQSGEVIPAPHDTLAGIDGLYWYNGSFVGVQYGTGANRVMRWKLSPDGRLVASSETLERGTELVKDPATGAILDDQFYFMANTGIANLDKSGNIVDEKQLEPLHFAVVPLK